MAAENCGIKSGDTVAVWGLGPVGQFAVKSAWMLGAGRVIAIDRVPERLELATKDGETEVIDYSQVDVYEALMDKTAGIGPDACIDAVGMEAHGLSLDALYDNVKQKTRLISDRSHALRQAINVCKKGGTLSIPGVYSGLIDKVNFGAAFAKGLTMKMGQTHTQRYMQPLLERIQRGDIDPSFVISHRLGLEDAPDGYEMFRAKRDKCTKIVMHPRRAPRQDVVH
jgi:threonine dehydrogenase-like Zn-dependent dehydrogenase